MVLPVGVIGVNFKTAELLLREAIAKSALSLSGERGLFFPHPTVLLSTCNRTEIYFHALDLAQAQSDLLSLLRRQVEGPFEHCLYSYFGLDCFAHLCRVTAGLDSAILAETEIQGQVKTAYAQASACLALPSALHYLFQKALKVAKSVRSHLALERGAPSLFGTLWHLAEQDLGPLQEKQILLVGYSEIHRGLASFLMHKGIEKLTFCTRYPETVQSWRTCGRDELSNWNRYDLISCASRSDGFLVRGLSQGRHVIFDLSVPRNVDPQVGTGAVRLYNIEQIGQLIEQKKCVLSGGLERLEECLWENVVHLAHLYRAKMQRSQICSVLL
jgi:glutamyl-tRNA reductase